MCRLLRVLFLLAFSAGVAFAQTLDELITDYQVEVAEIEVLVEQQQQTVTAGYLAGLARAKQQYQQQGLLKGVLAVDQAIKHARDGNQEVVRGPSSFMNQQKKYFAALAGITAKHAPQLERLRTALLTKLESMKKANVRAGKLDFAQEIDGEIKRLHATALVVAAQSTTDSSGPGQALLPEADARVQLKSGQPDGKKDRLSVKTGNTADTRFSFLRFDLARLRVPVERAELQLFCDIDSQKFQEHPPHDIHPVKNTTWNENTITGMNYPKISDTLLASFAPPPSNHFVRVDLTDAVSQALRTPHKKLNFVIRTKSRSDAYIGYASREHANEEQRPRLLINPPSQGVQLPAALRNGLALHLGFDRPNGDHVTNLAGESHHATMNGGQWTEDGKVGGGAWIDTKIYADMPITSTYNPGEAGTAAVWFKPLIDIGSRNREMVVMEAQDRNSFFAFNWAHDGAGAEHADGGIDFVITPEAESYSICQGQTTDWQKDTWYHLACTWDGTRQQLFVNGKLDGECEQEYTNPHQGVRLGRLVRGSVDEAMVWERVLSAEEIAELYQATGGTR